LFKIEEKSKCNSDTSNNDGHGHKVLNSNNVAFTTITMKNNFSSDVWILDIGASCHYRQSLKGLTEVQDINQSVKIGNSDSMKAVKIGNSKCEITQIDGENFMVTLNDVKYVPNLCVN
jgi:hypothetical protein